MTRSQWIILLAGFVLIGVSELFRPWVYEDENTSVRRSAGYHLFNRRPKLKSPAEIGIPPQSDDATKDTFNGFTIYVVRVNGVRLLAQRLFLISVTPGFIFAFAKRRVLSKILLTTVFLFSALCFLGLFAFDVWTMG